MVINGAEHNFFPQLPRQLQTFQLRKLSINLFGLGMRARRWNPLLEKLRAIATVENGVEVRLGQVSLFVFKSSF